MFLNLNQKLVMMMMFFRKSQVFVTARESKVTEENEFNYVAYSFDFQQLHDLNLQNAEFSSIEKQNLDSGICSPVQLQPSESQIHIYDRVADFSSKFTR
ncbi:hypothetical protein Nepgr_011661 [Nepenthes gracilis]|uniref:Uncharacterized protein n=1 Tax=Nepenthes gracilis TaxID=150966 RepID=A0AAD3SFJ4_NEPGR|nr:hypothetical protein Nepgr_011661 [Nepenthes gracilis]